MENLKNVLAIIFLFSIFSACEKDENNSPNHEYVHYKISSSLNSMFFDIGSYWLYENSNKSNTDSVIIKDIIKDTLELGPTMPGQGPVGEVEYYSIEYFSSFRGIYYKQLVGYLISQGCIYGGYLYLSSHEKGDSSWNAEISEIYDTLIVGGNTFSNVVKMEIQADDYVPTDMNLYYVDSVGIVKKEIVSNNKITETWYLLRYNTNLYQIQ